MRARSRLRTLLPLHVLDEELAAQKPARVLGYAPQPLFECERLLGFGRRPAEVIGCRAAGARCAARLGPASAALRARGALAVRARVLSSAAFPALQFGSELRILSRLLRFLLG